MKSIAAIRYADDDFQVSKIGNAPNGIIISEIGAGLTLKISILGGVDQLRFKNVSYFTGIISVVGNQSRYIWTDGMVGKVGDDM